MSGSRDGSLGWVSLSRAARFLDLSPDALRRRLERRAARVASGGVEAHIDGVRARKFGAVWRVTFSEAWLGSDVRVPSATATISSSRNPAK